MLPIKKLLLICVALSTWLSGSAQTSNTNAAFKHRLDSIVSQNYKQQSSYYHFARLYQRVSDGIAILVAEGKIRDTIFIAQIESKFASYYLRYYDSMQNGFISNYAWQLAFDTTKHSNRYATSVILSINAHINHDLYFALTEIFKQHLPTKANKKDFKLVAKVHDKIIADYFENAMPHLKADRKWKRQALRKLAKQVAKGLKIERNIIWNEAKKAATNNEKANKYRQRHLKRSQKFANSIMTPKGLLKKGIAIADTLDRISFAEKAFLLNNKRP